MARPLGEVIKEGEIVEEVDVATTDETELLPFRETVNDFDCFGRGGGEA